MRRLLFVAVFGLIMAVSSGAPVAAQAVLAPAANVAANCSGGVAAFLGFRSWDSCLTHAPDGGARLTSLEDIWLIAIVVLEDAFKVAGYAAVGFIVWGGIKYLKSQGDPGELTQARQIIHNALYGLVLTIISVAIITFIAGAF